MSIVDIVQFVLYGLLVASIAIMVWQGPRIIFHFRHDRMLELMLLQLPDEQDCDEDFFDIVETLCEDDQSFLWRVHPYGKRKQDSLKENQGQ